MCTMMFKITTKSNHLLFYSNSRHLLNVFRMQSGFWGWNCTNRCPENRNGRRCLRKCGCIETQVCHPVCWCLYYSKILKNGASIFLDKVTSSPFVEECPTTKDVLFTSTGLIYCCLFFFNSQELMSISMNFRFRSFSHSNIFIYYHKSKWEFENWSFCMIVFQIYFV